MCGIVGLFDAERTAHDTRAIIERACALMRHRGPDGGGITHAGGLTMGMRRLAIVDIEHGHQPMCSDDGSIALVYNGEIYNAPALRRELEREGVRFQTRSDTEVVLRLYERDPDHVEEHLAGMWAFAIHDRARNKLVLSRDRFGIKPLFVADVGGAIAFASDLRCLHPLRSDARFSAALRRDPASAHAMLSWGYVPEESTIYRGVQRIAPASRLEVDLASGRRSSRRTWELRPSAEASKVKSLDDACALVEPLLRRSVTEHLESDVPLAIFLSGGIDSSLISWFAREASPSPLACFSIGFRERRFDESSYARRAAERLGLPIHVETLDEDAARACLVEALLAYDEPFGDSSSVATYLLSRVVSRTHKVALGGDGGDEVFAGYKKHQIVRARGLLDHVPFAREALAAVLRAIPARTDRSRGWTEVLRTASRLARGLRGSDADAYVALTQVASLAKTAPLVEGGDAAARLESAARRRYEQLRATPLARTLAGDLANVLPNDMLTKVDRASMACHVEARVPMLDHRIVEVGVGLPASLTLGKKGKAVLRALHERRFGRELARRRKQGFGVPVERWLRGPLRPVCAELFSKRRLDEQGLLSSHELGDGAWMRWADTDPQILWHAFALAAWCEAETDPERLRELFEGRASSRASKPEVHATIS